jgi:hypothetical protein
VAAAVVGPASCGVWRRGMGHPVKVPSPIRIRHSTVWRTVIAVTAFSQVGALFAGWYGPMPRPLFIIVNGTLYYHLFRSEAAADQSGLLVRNFLRRTRRFAWSEVEDFRLGSPFPGISVGKVVEVLLTNGKFVPLDVTTRLRSAGRKGDDHLAALREWVA